MDLAQLDSDLKDALKARNMVAADTLRGLKSRIKNEEIAKTRALEENEILALIRSEVKRRREAFEAFTTGGRAESAQKEQDEIQVLSKYLPQGPSQDEITAAIDQLIAEKGLTAKDFGQLMGQLKQKFPNADGAALAALAKTKLQ